MGFNHSTQQVFAGLLLHARYYDGPWGVKEQTPRNLSCHSENYHPYNCSPFWDVACLARGLFSIVSVVTCERLGKVLLESSYPVKPTIKRRHPPWVASAPGHKVLSEKSQHTGGWGTVKGEIGPQVNVEVRSQHLGTCLPSGNTRRKRGKRGTGPLLQSVCASVFKGTALSAGKQIRSPPTRMRERSRPSSPRSCPGHAEGTPALPEDHADVRSARSETTLIHSTSFLSYCPLMLLPQNMGLSRASGFHHCPFGRSET